LDSTSACEPEKRKGKKPLHREFHRSGGPIVRKVHREKKGRMVASPKGYAGHWPGVQLGMDLGRERKRPPLRGVYRGKSH